MTSIPGSDNLAWSDEQTRLFLQLRIEENLKGNVRKQLVNEAGRLSIIEKFYDAFGERHPWKKFGNKFNSCKKQYESFKKFTRNRTGLGFDSTGFIDMSDDWWNERCKEWPGARKIKEKPIANMDLMEEVFGTVYITGDEGWTPQQGEENLDTTIPEDPINESDTASESRHSVLAVAAQEKDATTSSNRPRKSRKKSKDVQAGHVVADVIRDSIQSRDQILSHKNHLIENHPEFSCSQLRAMQVLHSLPSIRMWSPLYKLSIQHLKQDPTNRQTFLCYEEDENKILYLEFATGESRDA